MRYHWSAAAQAAFLRLKNELCSDNVLIPFDPSKQVIFTTDASPTKIGAFLSHEFDGNERPVAYASRALTQAEANYSQLDCEVLAIVYAVTHFYNYVVGKKFILVTDISDFSPRSPPATNDIRKVTQIRIVSWWSQLCCAMKKRQGQ